MLEQIKIPLSGEAEERLCRYLGQRIRGLKSGLSDLHENRIVQWRKAYEATPAESTREFPWHGASNLVVPVTAIHCDTLLARVMNAIIKTSPLWTARLIGKYPKKAIEFKNAFEEFMQYVGLEPTELDLYRVYHEWFGEAIRYGTSVLKCPWITEIEDKIAPAGDGTGKPYADITYEGPRPEKLPFNDFLMSPVHKTIESADFKAHRIRLSRFALEERAWRGIYDKAKVKEILGKPDLTSPDAVAQMQQTDAGAQVSATYGFEEYHIYECHFKYRVNRGRFVRCMAWYNEKNNKLLRAYYQYYPDEVFLAARLFYRDDYFYGYGFCETLGMFQEEISQIHNQRRDNSTVANTMTWRVDPDAILDKGYRVFPGATLPGKKGDIEGLSPGQVSPMMIDEERMSLELAEKRSGVSAPIQGMGSGVMSKRGVYSAMGTLSLLQEGNTRTDLNITDIRYAHTKLGRLLSKQYAEFGLGTRPRQFGLDGPAIQAAFEGIRDKAICLPVSASTASVNREVEKQADIMLSGLMQKHYQMIGQMLQAASNQFTPPEMKQYLNDSIEAANTLMKSVFRHFGYDEVERYVPEVQAAAAPQAPQRALPGGMSAAPGGGGAPKPPGPAGTPQGAPPPNNGAAPPSGAAGGGGVI